MKNLFVSLCLICLCFSCSQSKKEALNCQNKLTPKQDIQVLIDSFIKENKHDNYIYELYIDKIDPHNYNLILYAGEESLTKEENKDYNQRSVACTSSLGVKVNIYSGIEHYFEEISSPDFSSNHMQEKEGVSWAIRDSFGIVSCFKLEGGYPFIPFPLKNEPDAFTPPIIKTD